MVHLIIWERLANQWNSIFRRIFKIPCRNTPSTAIDQAITKIEFQGTTMTFQRTFLRLSFAILVFLQGAARLSSKTVPALTEVFLPHANINSNQLMSPRLKRTVILLLCALFVLMIQSTSALAAPRSLQVGNYDLKLDVTRASASESEMLIGPKIKLRDIQGKKFAGTATVSKSSLSFSFNLPKGSFWSKGGGSGTHNAKPNFTTFGWPMGSVSVEVLSANKNLARGTFRNYYSSGNWKITRKSK